MLLILSMSIDKITEYYIQQFSRFLTLLQKVFDLLSSVIAKQQIMRHYKNSKNSFCKLKESKLNEKD